MAAANNAGEDSQLSFPLPPTFYFKHYTNENVKSGNVPKPPPVIEGEYSMFGHTQKVLHNEARTLIDSSLISTEETILDDEIIQPLETQGIKRLYAKTEKFDHIVEMKKLNHSILVNYMELLDIMIDAPGSEERMKKIEEIKLLFINLHHLINEFRPHQARETLRIMLNRQKQQREGTTERLKDNIEKARAILKKCSTNLVTSPTATSTESSSGGSASAAPSGSTEADKSVADISDGSKELETLTMLQHKIMSDILDGIS